jgi:hypothetical protein
LQEPKRGICVLFTQPKNRANHAKSNKKDSHISYSRKGPVFRKRKIGKRGLGDGNKYTLRYNPPYQAPHF